MLRKYVAMKGSRNAIQFYSRMGKKKNKDVAKLLLFFSVIIAQISGGSHSEMKGRTLLGFLPSLYTIQSPPP